MLGRSAIAALPALPLTTALIAGCSLVRPYPAESDERGPLACHDSVDGDLDGLLDCDDPDCVGECPEEDMQACSNGRDDDRDGLVDARDPRCWPFATFSVDRECVEIRGGTVDWPGTPATPDTPATPRADIATSNVEGEEERVVVGATEITFPPGGPGFFFGTSVVTGDLAGMTIDMVIDAAPGRFFEVGVIRDGGEGALATGAAQGVGIRSRGTGGGHELFTLVGGAQASFTPRIAVDAPRAISVAVVISAVGEGFEARFDVDGGPREVVRQLPSGWTATTPVRIYARAEAGELGTDVRVRSLRVTRPAFDCGRVVRMEPELPELDRQPRRVLAAVDTGRRVICAVVAAGPDPDGIASSLHVMRSRDCGVTFELVEPIDMTVALDWVPARVPVASSAALVVSDDGDWVDLAIGLPQTPRLLEAQLHDVALGTLSIDDCSIVREIEPSELQTGEASPHDPLLQGLYRGAFPRATALGLGPARGATTRLWFVGNEGHDEDLVSSAVSPCPDAICPHSCGLPMGSWTCGPAVRRVIGFPELTAALGAGVIELGGDVIVTAVPSVQRGELTAMIPIVDPISGDFSRRLDVPLSIGARTRGAFDELGVGFPTLMPFLPDTACDSDGLLFVGGLPASPETAAIETEVLPYWFTIPPAI